VQRWDLFISHATEDKEDAAIPLFAALERAGMTVTYLSGAISRQWTLGTGA
jgi:hypothetical protein